MLIYNNRICFYLRESHEYKLIMTRVTGTNKNKYDCYISI